MATAFVTPVRGRQLATVTARDYQAGVCNIGPDEVARRMRIGHAGAAVTVLLFALLVALHAPPLARFVIAAPAAAAAAGYIQAFFRFCVAFGSAGVFNFGPHGTTRDVANPADRARDRLRAIELSAAIAVIGAGVGLIAVLVPI